MGKKDENKTDWGRVVTQAAVGAVVTEAIKTALDATKDALDGWVMFIKKSCYVFYKHNMIFFSVS